MNIKDLKTGMIVEVRSGARYLVLRDFGCQYPHIDDCMVSINHSYSWFLIKDYSNNLTYKFDDRGGRYDIVKVFRVKHPYNIVAHEGFMEEYDIKNPSKSDDNELQLVWERPTAKKMSKADIEAALGYKIEIVE